mmetsp:Transcript_35498/g.81250  ORF Transcript_35498/g.81250 Transcript_35498/m.81250 type:complete len:443 (-) Transcript_35498:45-1373(-)
MKLVLLAACLLARASAGGIQLSSNTQEDTPPPVPLGGVFCRGASCMYRRSPSKPGLAAEPPPGPWRGSQDFCRGLGCVEGLGFPMDPRREAWKVKCTQLLTQHKASLGDASQVPRDTILLRRQFLAVCPDRVGAKEAQLCSAYADVITSSVASLLDAPSVGTDGEVCLQTYHFITAVETAVKDLQLREADVRGPLLSKVLLSAARKHSPGEGRGQTKGNLRSWQEIGQRYVGGLVPLRGTELHAAGAASAPAVGTLQPCPQASRQVALIQEGAPQVLIPVNMVEASEQCHTSLPPLPVTVALFHKCESIFTDVMLGTNQTAITTATLTKGWCGWQASAEAWGDEAAGTGHPDWDHRTCEGMELLMAFALRNRLDDRIGMTATEVCNEFFLGAAIVSRVDQIMQTALEPPVRGVPTDGVAEAHEEFGHVVGLLQRKRAARSKL